MKTEGILVGIYQMPNQYSAVTACYSDITPRLRRRASLSMFISLETRHLVWDSKLFLLFFLLSCCLARFVFSTKQSWKKLAPTSLIVFGQSGRPMTVIGVSAVLSTGLLGTALQLLRSVWRRLWGQFVQWSLPTEMLMGFLLGFLSNFHGIDV